MAPLFRLSKANKTKVPKSGQSNDIVILGETIENAFSSIFTYIFGYI